MVITYFGKQFFKITQGELVLALNPVSKSSKSGVSAHFGADIALVSANHPDYNGSENVAYGDKQPFVIAGPGEYEVKDIFIRGFLTDTEIGGKPFINTVYSFTLDGINVAFLGAFAGTDIPKDAREAIGDADLLFLPLSVAGNPKDAAKVAASLGAKVVIPMDYDDASLKAFLKESGDESPERLDKLTVKRKDFEGKDGSVVVLKY